MKPIGYIIGIIGIALTSVIFLLPFAFILLTAMKPQKEANLLQFSWPEQIVLWENIVTVIQTRDFMLIIAFINSTILTVASVTLMVIFGAMVAYVLQRRKSWLNPWINGLVLAGLIIPPAVVPTIWVMQTLGIFKTLPGLILIEVAFGLSFTVLMMRAFIAGIPKEIDEAAIVDGAGPMRLFFQVVLPLLRGVIITVVVVQSVFVFNDFQNPLYFLPGDQNATVQLTLFNFQSQFNTSYNLLFTNIMLITIPPLIMYIFFQRQIVAGMTSGAVKG
ncbi:carbohydrate ABC transporter permease [Tessaracoccus sp. MC1679]|uniref:carbohydrate ABC transporter permease n=1 Tax=unclassified Tessaracoccus TaxID=2635419 RepID=UPI0016038826|nr:MULTISPECIES: carbohydrate ABC transporter permease [unclassified Tessaracoccus]MBB1511870.1 carbohydrate ABC transporter permease [Tessaracoccus sp. MC1627]MBB1514443.1 carbohydrate ABC transporter permease [Tessaracoccus sp. MC1679]